MKNKTYYVFANKYQDQEVIICEECDSKMEPSKYEILRTPADKDCECDICGKV